MIVVRTGFGADWPSPQKLASFTVAAISASRSMSPGFPLPAQMSSRIASICWVPSRQGVHFPHDSLLVKVRK